MSSKKLISSQWLRWTNSTKSWPGSTQTAPTCFPCADIAFAHSLWCDRV